MSGFEGWIAGATGSYLLTCDPIDGQTSFFGDVVERRGGDALLVTTARSVERVPAPVRSAVDEIVDATPRPAEVGTNVGSPSDLTGISMPVSTFLQDAGDPAVVVDSVSPLLYHAEDVAVFRFISVLSTHVARSDGLGIFAMVPSAHPVETFHTFEQVFDGHIDVDDPGDRVRIRVRTDAIYGPAGVSGDVPDGWQPL